MLRTIKNYLRRRQLTRRGVSPRLALTNYSAGHRSGVWVVWPEPLTPDSLVYSFGVGDNLGWELALIERFGLTVHAFDPTPASVSWVAQQTLPSRLHFHPTGLAGHDGFLSFTLPARGSRFNYRPLAGDSSAPQVIHAPVARLTTLLRKLDHKTIDILKIDIEGGEYPAIKDLLATSLRIPQLLIEFHHHFPGIGLEATLDVVAALEQQGYLLFHLSGRGLEFSFVHRSALARAHAA